MKYGEKDFEDKVVWFGYCESGKTFGTRDYYKQGTALECRYQRGWDKGRKEIEDDEQNGTCDHCGEEMPVSHLIKSGNDYHCADCHTDVEIDEGPQICPDCNGSGEGYCEEQLCWRCKGSGAV